MIFLGMEIWNFQTVHTPSLKDENLVVDKNIKEEKIIIHKTNKMHKIFIESVLFWNNIRIYFKKSKGFGILNV